MKRENLVEAISEAKRFLEKAKRASTSISDPFYIHGKDAAACKRASMDLTIALSKLRKG